MSVVHVAVFAFPFGSHATALLHLIKKLTSLAPPNNLIFSLFNTSESNNLIFSGSNNGYHELGNIIRAYNISDGLPEGYVFRGNPLEPIRLFMAAAPAALTAAVAEAEAETGRPVTCMVADAFLWFVTELAHEKGVPYIPCWISGVHSLSIHAYTDIIRQRFASQGFEEIQEKTLDFIPGLSKIRIKDIPDSVFIDEDTDIFSHMLLQMSRALPKAAAIGVNCCEEMDEKVIRDLRSKFSNVLPIGPLGLLVEPPKGIDGHNFLGWLDKQEPNSVVYVAFGSAATPNPAELAALAQALEASGLKFLWSLKDHLKVHLPGDFLDNAKSKGLIIPWAPQVEVLTHKAVGVFITHFGYNSVTESIAARVPMIGRPFFGDQGLNGRLVEAVWEIGLQIEGGIFTKDGVLRSLNRILWSDQGKKMRTNLTNLSEKVRKAVGSNGSSIDNFLRLLDVVTMN